MCVPEPAHPVSLVPLRSHAERQAAAVEAAVQLSQATAATRQFLPPPEWGRTGRHRAPRRPRLAALAALVRRARWTLLPAAAPAVLAALTAFALAARGGSL